ncbi:MAG: class I tRNA ligase family protein, partial [Rhizomicrobium sp.]
PEILKANVEAYRRLRNTIRFLLANLKDFTSAERIAVSGMGELERFMLAKLAWLDEQVREYYAGFDFNRLTATLFNFCTNDLSAFYFDIRKDALYCDPEVSPRRRAVRTAMDEIFRRVVTWFAPILSFTMEEAWASRHPESKSVHLEIFPETPAEWRAPGLIAKWQRLRELRRVVTGALERERAAKRIGSSLEALPTIHVCDRADWEGINSVPFAEVAITSGLGAALGDPPAGAFALADVPGVAVTVELAGGRKCARCWMVLPQVGTHQRHPDLCDRCDAALELLDA